MGYVGVELVAAISASMAFAFWIVLRLPKGLPRLVALMPWIFILYTFPSRIPTVHARAIVAFFCLWLVPFKLLLLCWDRGPAADPWVRNNFARFFATMTMSLNIPRCGTFLETVGSSKLQPKLEEKHSRDWFAVLNSQNWQAVLIRASFKSVLVILLFCVYAWRQTLADVVLYLVFSLHIYLACSLIFEALAAIAAATIGMELEPQFDKPFIASSISDFWGRRWNRLVSSILRASVYEPAIALFSRDRQQQAQGSSADLLSSSNHQQQPAVWIRALATMLVFVVSGLMHELIFFHMNKTKPTWEATAFFVLNGIATVIEVTVRRAFKGRFHIPKALSIPLTLGFIFSTASWLFFPPIHRPGTCFEALHEFEVILHWLFTTFKMCPHSV